MGNHPSKERSPNPETAIDPPPNRSSPSTHSSAANDPPPTSDRQHASRIRTGRHEISLFGLPSRSEIDPASPEARKETKAEREARKLEKERAQRVVDRARSMAEEGVDGGYVVTLGVYTGTEDFSKPIVRQLMIERRLAPFWKGLNDLEDSWADNQLVAVARGLPLPPPEEPPPLSKAANPNETTPEASTPNTVLQTVSIPQQLPTFTYDTPSLSPSHPAFSPPSPKFQNQTPQPAATLPTASNSSDWITGHSQSPSASLPFFRGRAKTLASLTSLSRNTSQSDMSPQEMQLPKDPYVNGQPIEAYLYRQALECPICFLYYPPFLNKTRCCDQPICSECFVQIKRPDPHPPEHHDDEPNGESSEAPVPSEDYQLVSEPATCPYCKMPEFGITYEPPPFRRGLAYANQPSHFKSAMSSSSSISSMGINGHSRRRNQSLSIDSPLVITTDKIRPDWAKKLADARAHALRRAAAATALHNAAYVLGNNGEGSSRFSLGRRRRTFFNPEGDMPANINLGNIGSLLAAADRQQAMANRDTDGQNDLFPGRSSSRRSRIDTLEELMMMEAIRQSIAAEEERKRKEEKEAAKKAKKDEKQRQKELKEAKKQGKLMARTGSFPLGAAESNPASPIGESSTPGKGKAVDTGQRSTSPQSSASPHGIPVFALHHPTTAGAENVLSTSAPPPLPAISSIDPLSNYRQDLNQLSINDSSASSFSDLPSIEIGPNGTRLSSEPETPTADSFVNFRSLAEVIDDEAMEHGKPNGDEHINSQSSDPLEQSTSSTLTANSETPTIVGTTPHHPRVSSAVQKLPSTEVIQENNTSIKGKGRAAAV